MIPISPVSLKTLLLYNIFIRYIAHFNTPFTFKDAKLKRLSKDDKQIRIQIF